ncbi:hypothetical protein D3C73_914250 [compost metagenome]
MPGDDGRLGQRRETIRIDDLEPEQAGGSTVGTHHIGLTLHQHTRGQQLRAEGSGSNGFACEGFAELQRLAGQCAGLAVGIEQRLAFVTLGAQHRCVGIDGQRMAIGLGGPREYEGVAAHVGRHIGPTLPTVGHHETIVLGLQPQHGHRRGVLADKHQRVATGSSGKFAQHQWHGMAGCGKGGIARQQTPVRMVARGQHDRRAVQRRVRRADGLLRGQRVHGISLGYREL